ncbi:MAG: sugar phosphate isomerase/epimerase family protein [Bryobacteraceae bacterium]
MIKLNVESTTRRQALLAALGSAGTTMMGKAMDLAPAARQAMRVGCGTVCFRTLPLQEALQRIARAGYEYVETQATAPFCPHVDPWKDDPQKFRRLVREFGFKGVTALWSHNGAIIPDAKSVDGVTQTIRWAKEAGIPVVNAGDGRRPDGMSEEDALRVLHDKLTQILEVAGQCKVYLAIEPHGTFSLTAEGLQKIMKLSESKWLGINYDTANVRRAAYVETAAGAYKWSLYGQRQDEVVTLDAVADRVIHVHVKDVVGAKCVALGEGAVNIRGCLQVLKRHRYAGILSLETEGEFGTDESQRLIEVSRTYLVKELQKL